MINNNNSKKIVIDKTFNGNYQNVKGLRTKLNTIRVNIYDLDYDYLSLTETWLHSGINDNELGLHNFNIYRLDRNSNTSPYKRGGGVAICVKKIYHSELLSTPFDSIEHIFVRIKINVNDVIIIRTCYIPLSTPSSRYIEHANAIEYILSTIDNNTRLILLGDYNLPNIIISSNNLGLTFNGTLSYQFEALINYFSYFGFYQHNSIFNNAGSLLDLVFSNDINTYVTKLNTTGLVPPDEYHPILKIVSILKDTLSSNNNKNNYVLKDFKKANYESICKSFNIINWDNLFSNKDIDNAVNIFYETVNNIIETQVPKRYQNKSQYPPWFNSNLRKLIKNKNVAHKLLSCLKTSMTISLFLI